MDADEKKYFSMLPVGQGIVKLQDRWTSPIHVQFPLVKVNKGSVTDQMLARYSAINQAKSTGSGRNTSLLFGDFAKSGQVRRVQLYDIPLKELALAFIEDVLRYPDDGVKIRYKRLGLSIGTGSKLKGQLLDQGWLESQTVEIGQTRKVILRPTRQSKDALNLDSSEPQYGSIAHEYWKRFYAQRFGEQGYQVNFEVPRISSGRVDVVAEKDGKKIAIEIETGKSNFLQNIGQDLLAKYDKIIVVATDKNAYDKIEKTMAKEGLIIPSKVILVQRKELP
jgi:hypothetical protein